MEHSPPREEGWLRHQENFGEAHLSAADGVVAHKANCGVSDPLPPPAALPLTEGENKALPNQAAAHTPS